MAAAVQYYGTGRRKTSTARVFLRPGKGAILVNRAPVERSFPTEALRTQVRALLRAAAGQELRVMIPMVSTASEMDKVRMLVDKERDIMRLKGYDAPKKVLLGAMIEVPCLLFELDALMKKVDFVSVGSNDLLQFMYAADRTNARVASRYDSLSPAPLRAELARGVVIMTRQVSQAEYAACVRAGACKPLDPGLRDLDAPDLPAIGLSWSDASAYAAWLSDRSGQHWRLPTYAEWVYAAGEAYRDALAYGAENPVALAGLANIFQEQGEASQAIEYYERALAIEPAFRQAWNNLGNTYRKLNQPRQAVECYRRSLQLPQGRVADDDDRHHGRVPVEELRRDEKAATLPHRTRQ